jgi:uncharacterized membrane protein YuzA (DUF378 family)
MKCKYTAGIALALAVIGALNWGLWGFFQFDLVAWLFGGNTTGVSRVIYSIIGLAGLVSIRILMCCKKCGCPCHEKEGHDMSCCDKDKKKNRSGCCK